MAVDVDGVVTGEGGGEGGEAVREAGGTQTRTVVSQMARTTEVPVARAPSGSLITRLGRIED